MAQMDGDGLAYRCEGLARVIMPEDLLRCDGDELETSVVPKTFSGYLHATGDLAAQRLGAQQRGRRGDGQVRGRGVRSEATRQRCRMNKSSYATTSVI